MKILLADAPAPDVRLVDAMRFNLAPDSRSFDCKFIEPGLVSYRDQGGGIELLRKETIDRCIASAVGNPLTVGHVTVTAANRMRVENGCVHEWYYNAEEGWFYVKGVVDTDDAKSRIRRGQRPSCGYRVKSFGPGGVYHGIKYDQEITDIEFNHLAIVEKPRYEDAIFRLNSIVSTQTNMQLFKFLKKLVTRENGADGKVSETTKVESHEVRGDTEVVINIEGKDTPVRLNQLVESWKTAAGQVFTASADDEVEIDGQKVKMNELVECYKKNSAARSNAAPVAVPPPVETPEQKATRENAAPAPVAPAPVETPEQKATRENAAEAEKKQGVNHFFTLRTARENASGTDDASVSGRPTSGSLLDRVKAGQDRYSSVPVVAGKN